MRTHTDEGAWCGGEDYYVPVVVFFLKRPRQKEGSGMAQVTSTAGSFRRPAGRSDAAERAEAAGAALGGGARSRDGGAGAGTAGSGTSSALPLLLPLYPRQAVPGPVVPAEGGGRRVTGEAEGAAGPAGVRRGRAGASGPPRSREV